MAQKQGHQRTDKGQRHENIALGENAQEAERDCGGAHKRDAFSVIRYIGRRLVGYLLIGFQPVRGRWFRFQAKLYFKHG